jgi:hypothetical protein
MAQFNACTLCLSTVRTGWPTAEIHFYINDISGQDAYTTDILVKMEGVGIPDSIGTFCHLVSDLHHAEWIQKQVMGHREFPEGTLVLVDGDTVWWKNCEDWEFSRSALLAGYYIPRIWNDFAKCVSVPRFHTSCMVFPSTSRIYGAVYRAYPYAFEQAGEYCPCDPFMPAVRLINGKPIFWDSCANLFAMLQSLDNDALTPFKPEHLACFDHLNSASFYDVMMKRLDDNSGFARAHDLWVKHPVPGLWPIVNKYYADKAIQAQVMQPL